MLRAYFENIKLVSCPMEDDFKQLYEHLGDRITQEQIRSESLSPYHCKLLISSPVACIGCPNNPYEDVKLKEKILDAHAHSDLISHCYQLQQRCELYGTESFTQEELEAVEVINEYKRHQDREAEAKQIAYEVGVILGKMFGNS